MENDALPSDSLRQFFADLCARIVQDFGLDRLPERNRETGLQKVVAMVLELIVIESAEHLSTEEEEEVIAIGSPQTEESSFATLDYLMTQLADKWPIVVNRAYNQVVEVALKSVEQSTDRTLTEAEALEHLVGAGSSFVDVVQESRGSESEPTGLVMAAVELLVDPARAVRTPEQRQARFFLKARELLGKALTLIWSSALLFTIADTLVRYHVIHHVPELLRIGLPSWLFANSLLAQWRLFAMLTVVVIVALILISFCARFLTRSNRATKWFDVNLAPEDYASHYLALSDLSSDDQAEMLRRTSDLIYRTVYLDSGRANRDDLAILNEMLSMGDEKRVIVFLKSKVGGYRQVLRQSVESFEKRSRRIMDSIP